MRAFFLGDGCLKMCKTIPVQIQCSPWVITSHGYMPDTISKKVDGRVPMDSFIWAFTNLLTFLTIYFDSKENENKHQDATKI